MMLNGALANVTQPLKDFDESDMLPQNEGFIELLNIQFGLLNHSCQNFGEMSFLENLLFWPQTQGLMFKGTLKE